MGGEKEPSQVLGNSLFLKIFQTFRMAIQPSKLIIAFLALAVLCLAGWIMDFSNTVVTAGNGDTELQVYLTNPNRIQPFIEANKETGQRTGVFSTLWHFAAAKFQGSIDSLFAFNMPRVALNIIDYFRAVGWALRYHFLYCKNLL